MQLLRWAAARHAGAHLAAPGADGVTGVGELDIVWVHQAPLPASDKPMLCDQVHCHTAVHFLWSNPLDTTAAMHALTS
jgi:hypothetical protein